MGCEYQVRAWKRKREEEKAEMAKRGREIRRANGNEAKERLSSQQYRLLGHGLAC
jgi:hypothetical protein